MRRIAVVLALVVALSGVTALTAPLAHAACRQLAGPGAPLPAAAGQEPLINRLGLRRDRSAGGMRRARGERSAP